MPSGHPTFSAIMCPVCDNEEARGVWIVANCHRGRPVRIGRPRACGRAVRIRSNDQGSGAAGPICPEPSHSTASPRQRAASRYSLLHHLSQRPFEDGWADAREAGYGASGARRCRVRAIRKVNAGMMPLAGAVRPDAATLRGLTPDRLTLPRSLIESRPSPLHRLNRNEYANAIRDLPSLDIDAALPARRRRRGLRQRGRSARRLFVAARAHWRRSRLRRSPSAPTRTAVEIPTARATTARSVTSRTAALRRAGCSSPTFVDGNT